MERPRDGAVDGPRQARDRLSKAERKLWDAAAEFAAARRALPAGPLAESATPLTTAAGKPVTLAGLFGSRRVLIGYHLRFDEGWLRSCPDSARWVDGLDSLVEHLAPRAAVVVFAPASPGALHDEVQRRGWRRIEVVSTQPSRLTDDLGLRRDDGLRAAVSLFRWMPDGTMRRNVFAADVPGGPWSLLDLVEFEEAASPSPADSASAAPVTLATPAAADRTAETTAAEETDEPVRDVDWAIAAGD
ncbi:DUF899 family protein [Actinoalloteichus hymeniacidonis]|uniref:Uncharacterized protein n=1 Tax=Actinoalloteichus hymeniacidonis TaxID=340345 RepID=A0AAC9HPF9_9PSEU|nr:DUF899 family protein [Actinoalloteichus hymeniacidonis]AOS63079.1 hypothetical protein TL08_11325 [Actinoalloteichus hymeniacidonis]MBB5908885.1 putative dithiol-disulfide oxidoreductase (DUF899 family) [Actinoalloteichus hymeniacidonis]